MSVVIPATSGHLGRLIVQDLLDRGILAFAFQNGDLSRLLGRPTTPLVDGLRPLV